MAIASNALYGSDKSGLIFGYLFEPNASGRPVNGGEAVKWLAHERERRTGGFLWLHYDLANVATEKWLLEHLELSSAFFEAVHEGSRATRIDYADGALVAIVNDVLVQIVRTAMTQVDDIEDSLLAGRLDHKRVNLGALRRVLVRLQRVLAPEPAALFRLLNRPPAWVADSDLQELRHSTEEFSAVLSDVAVLLERIKLLQEEMTSQINQQNKRSLFLLTVFTVLALPINIIAGLFGMNVGGVPLAQSDQGFWIIVGLAGWRYRVRVGDSTAAIAPPMVLSRSRHAGAIALSPAAGRKVIQANVFERVRKRMRSIKRSTAPDDADQDE